MTRSELFDKAYALKRKASILRGAGHIEGAQIAEAEYRLVCSELINKQ